MHDYMHTGLPNPEPYTTHLLEVLLRIYLGHLTVYPHQLLVRVVL